MTAKTRERSTVKLSEKDFEYEDGKSYRLDRTVTNFNHDRRCRLPSSDHRGIDRIPVDTVFKASVFTKEDDVGGLKIAVTDISLQGQRGTPFEFTRIDIMKTSRMTDEGKKTSLSVSPSTDFSHDVVNSLIPIEDPLSTLIARAVAEKVDGWDVVRSLVEMFATTDIRQVEAAIRSVKKTGKV